MYVCWKPGPTLEVAESKLSFDLKFAGQTDRLGLGNNRYTQKLTAKAIRKRISLGLAHDHDRKAELHSMSLALQGGWTKWRENVKPRDLKWKDLIFLKNPKIFSHYLNASISTLPTPSRLHLWGYSPSPLCSLCDDNKKGTLMHIFSNCKVALLQGRYSWRHDSFSKPWNPHFSNTSKLITTTKPFPRQNTLSGLLKKVGGSQPVQHPLPSPISSARRMTGDA